MAGAFVIMCSCYFPMVYCKSPWMVIDDEPDSQVSFCNSQVNSDNKLETGTRLSNEFACPDARLRKTHRNQIKKMIVATQGSSYSRSANSKKTDTTHV